jgi:hypothetical protein
MIVPLAYKYVAVAVMLAEINYCAGRLHLPIDLPIKEQDVKAAVFPPRAIGFALPPSRTAEPNNKPMAELYL